jgi:hypothetical protein
MLKIHIKELTVNLIILRNNFFFKFEDNKTSNYLCLFEFLKRFSTSIKMNSQLQIV